ncbi:MAG: type II toxin-antitoxin system RelE/ParE family toxin [Neisseriaceae bacterium]|nr:type II toxin-antitoxin system RelE/ParE family toxin [Neisseriaceae bacterium]
MNTEKPIEWRDTSLDDLKRFPLDAIKHFGYELGLVQNGLEPTDFKPMVNLGNGVMELRKKLPDGAFRVVYVVKFERAVFVLHCFQKKSQQTAKKDIDIIKQRYRALIQELKNG